jgi:outer membrane protein assembly factor BamA
MFGYSSTYRPNPPVDALSDEIDLDIYGFSVSLNPRNVLITNRFTVAGSIVAELADNGASDEEYRFNKYRTELKLFYNFEPGSVLRWRLQAGGITGNAPDFKDFYLGGIGTLRGSPFKFFRGNQMLASNLEVQFGRPSARAGEWIRDYNLHLLLFLDSGWARDIPDLIPSNNPFSGLSSFSFSGLQHDAGVGIGTGALRFELAWPLRAFGPDPVFWVRLNPTF